MIGWPRGVDLFLYGGPCDIRRSFNTLSALIRQDLERDLLGGDLSFCWASCGLDAVLSSMLPERCRLDAMEADLSREVTPTV